MLYWKWQTGVLILVTVVMALFGCAASNNALSEKNVAGGPVYIPHFLPEIGSPEMARNNLAALMSGENDRVPGVKVEGLPNVNDPGRRVKLTELAKGASGKMHLHCNGTGEPVYALFNSIAVLDDGIRASDRIHIDFADILDAKITVQLGRSEEVKSRSVIHIANSEDGESRSIDNDLRPYIVTFHGISFHFETLDDAARFSDNIFYVQQVLSEKKHDDLALFETKAAKYRAMNVKPLVTEEQRKYIVQANAMNKRKDYAKSIELYTKALEVNAVSYPGAYFNLALLSAQLERYGQAISYMNRYLMLEPDAKDTRSARDKIYEWEAMLEK
jgi:tetratricopeptide (TPR) repeat protein